MKQKILPLGFLISLLTAVSLQAQYFNYAEALQKYLYFYDAEKCGLGIIGEKLEWRGNCHVEDAEMPLNEVYTNMNAAFISANASILDADGNGLIDLSGGYHDAGDHVQFGLPQSYSSQTIEWALYEFPNSFVEIGEYEHILDLTKWASDYYLKCTYRNTSGEVVAFCYQVGEGNEDHNYWGSPELQSNILYPRYSYFATAETPASDQCAGAAASLAITYLNRKNIDPNYANECLEVAIALYDFAVKNRGLGYSGGFYNSSFDEDELALAAVWLYTATNNYTYIEDIISKDAAGANTGWLKKIILSQQDDWQNIWVHSWDTKWGGVFAKLAPITNNSMHWYIFRWNIEYWANIAHENTNDGNFITQTPAGFSWIAGWGSARYNAAAQFCALVYCKEIDRPDFRDWAKGQMEYIMGDNPLGRSYIVGYSDNYASHPHHRASHGSSTNTALDPVDQKHVLWGALVGGPDINDNHVDETNDFISNEVAIDYNAGLVGALAGHYYFYGEGDEPLSNFPPLEPETEEYFLQAMLEQENNQRTQVTIAMNNATVHAPRIGQDLKAQYYFNISEMIANGQTINDVSMAVYYDESGSKGKPAKSSGPFVFDAEQGIYYYEFEWENADFYGDMDLQFALIAGINASWEYSWDPTNDFSRQGLSNTKELNQYIPIFVDGVHYSGLFPNSNIDTTPIPVTGVSLLPTSLNFNAKGATSLIEATIFPTNASNKSLLWSSEDPAIATVNAEGLVTAIGNGTTNILATTTDGGFIATCEVSVLIVAPIPVNGVTVNPETLTLEVGQKAKMVVAVSPHDATNKDVLWSIENSTIASVNSIGEVTAIAEGSTLLIVITLDGGYTVSANITVVPKNPANCDFGTPLATALPSINTSFNNIHVLGSAGPDLSNVTNLTINWDLSNNGLWQISMSTNNGQPDWYNNLLGNTSQTFNTAQPEIALSETGISGLDGTYYVTIDDGNFVMDEKSGTYSIYFSNSSTPPCVSLKEAELVQQKSLNISNIKLYPNPFSTYINLHLEKPENVLNINIVDQTGRILNSYSKNDISSNLRFGGNLPDGIYLIQIQSTDGVESQIISKH